jgi:hypothetical protein
MRSREGTRRPQLSRVRAILFGMNADELELDLAKIFPNETVIHDEPTDDKSNTLCFLSWPNARLDFAVDIRSSSFRRKVWNVNVLSTIPSARPLTFA